MSLEVGNLDSLSTPSRSTRQPPKVGTPLRRLAYSPPGPRSGSRPSPVDKSPVRSSPWRPSSAKSIARALHRSTGKGGVRVTEARTAKMALPEQKPSGASGHDLSIVQAIVTSGWLGAHYIPART
eukprot:scaffold21518_cov39-Prasinocladus_malaysianus.AAC.1